MSKIIERLVKDLEDELKGARSYIDTANMLKCDRPELALEYCRKAEEELKHAMFWHDYIVKEIEIKKSELLKENNQIPNKMIITWEIRHEMYIETCNNIKREILIYKGA